jgi:ferredoxin-type protein NapH
VTCTALRRCVQVFFFALIIWGVFLWPRHLRTPLPKIPSGTPRTTLYERNRILWVSGKESVFDLYMPILACRFVAHGGVFKSCSVHLLSENITWRTSLRLLMPHIAFLVVLSFLFSRMWCGWACPLGAIQDGMDWIRRKIGIAPVRVGTQWGDVFAKLRQFLLFGSLGISALIMFPLFGSQGVNDALFLVYCQLCPSRILYPPLGGVMPCWYDASSGIAIFLTVLGWLCILVFLASLFIPRLWCRICAVGALLTYFNRGGLPAIRKNHRKCTSCGTCERCCPVEIPRVYEERLNPDVTDGQCILCLRCVEGCPESGCLHARIGPATVLRS